jgi:hypothetical protein
MKRFTLLSLIASMLVFANYSCGDKPGDVRTDSLTDSMPDFSGLSDSAKTRFKKIMSALPVPFDIMKQFSGAKLPYKGNLLSNPDNAGQYSETRAQALNLGIYGADMAYNISQDKLSESGPYLGSVRRLSDAIVIPSAFDASVLSRYDVNKNLKDSMQILMSNSYKRIDSTLQSSDRLMQATLVIYGGWLESMYITTQHIGDEPQTDKNKVLYDMLAAQQPYIATISDLLVSFPNDSTCAWLYRETEKMAAVFPTGDLTAGKFSERLKLLRDMIAEVRNKLIRVS